jgi:predicted DNA-binding ribbon-helix-helix protein
MNADCLPGAPREMRGAAAVPGRIPFMLETELIAGNTAQAASQSAITSVLGKSRLVNRNVNATSGRTSMRLEPEVWEAIREICLRDDIDLGELIRRVEQSRPAGGRTSAVRVYVLQYFRHSSTEDGHRRAGHGARDELVHFSQIHGAALRLPD